MKKNNFNNNDFESDINKFKNMNEDQLMTELLKYANIGRKDGTISNEKLDAFYENAIKFMTYSQQQKLKELINIIKSS